jgi:TonB family protein
MSAESNLSSRGELNLLREWREPISPRRVLRDGLGSLVVHAVIVAAILLAPDVQPPIQQTPDVDANLKAAVHLTLPPRVFEPTQKDPNKGKVARGLDLRSATEGQPQPRRFRPPTPAPAPAPEPPSTPSIEAPKIEVASGAPVTPIAGIGAPSAGPPPAPERPKLALESVTGGTSTKPNPNPNVRLELPKPTPDFSKVTPRPAGGGGFTVGDIGETAPSLTGVTPAPTPCQECSTLQLLSDPQSVDFKPYLQQVLALVKRNWLSVIPESARFGRRGVVLLQFSIDRRGLVPKVVIATPSGVEAFDRAAVAGLSMSNPLPPLPAEYKGDQVRLQMAFSYNVAPAR